MKKQFYYINWSFEHKGKIITHCSYISCSSRHRFEYIDEARYWLHDFVKDFCRRYNSNDTIYYSYDIHPYWDNVVIFQCEKFRKVKIKAYIKIEKL